MATLSLAGCSSYLWQAALEQGKILARREPIALVTEDPRTTPELREKLRLVQNVRLYSTSLGLDPKRSFTLYAKVDRSPLLWVLVGARPDSFTLATWHFPIVGAVPYKGFFERKNADVAGQELLESGYEISIRGSDAFSTLGWFNDPILSNLLNRPELDIINTVIHEIVHTTVWLPGQVSFNESLANFIGHAGAKQYTLTRRAHCGEQPSCHARWEQLVAAAELDLQREIALAQIVTKTYHTLKELYDAPLSSEEKRTLREPLFAAAAQELRNQIPTASLFQKPNNAELIQIYLYLQGLEDFQALFTACGGSFPRFLNEVRALIDARPDDPFALLKQRVEQLRLVPQP